MTSLNGLQFAQFVENYVSHIVEGLDFDSMEQMLIDLLIREYDDVSQEQIITEIQELYGEEVAADLLESVTTQE
jgi:hypothetical protein